MNVEAQERSELFYERMIIMTVKDIQPEALYMISSGVYIVSTGYEGTFNGQIANTAMQLTGPPEICLATALHKDNYTTELLRKSGQFSLSVLDETVPMTFIGNFGFKCGRDVDKFAKCEFQLHGQCLPIVTQHTLATLCAKVIHEYELHTHILFVGEVIRADLIASGTPLTYKMYHEIKKGKSPKHAPTFILNEASPAAKKG